MNKTNRATSFLLVFAVVSLLTSAPVGAASFTWTGVRASENWDDVSGGAVFITNWIPVSVVLMIPGSGDNVVFSDTGADFVVDLNGDRQVVSAAFTGTEGYTLNNTLTLSSGDITSTGLGIHFINSNVELGAAGDWDIDTTVFLVNGNISSNFALKMIGTGSLALLGTNTYTGNTRIDSGVLLVSNSGDSIPDTSPVSIAAGATFQVNNVTEQIEGLQNASGAVVLTLGATLGYSILRLKTP